MIGETLGRLLFPPRCPACRTLLDWRAPHERVRAGEPSGVLCPACAEAWREAEAEECGGCACPVRECLCMPRLMRGARIRGFFKLVYYTPRTKQAPPNRVIYHLKRQDDRRTQAMLAHRLSVGIAEGLRTEGISLSSCVVTYLPRTARARGEAGFDQSERLARAIARTLEIPMHRLLGRRLFSNRKQKTLTPKEREENAKRAFVGVNDGKCTGKTVLLVDDVVTTGAGMSACARILYRMGASRVLAVCIATDDVNRDMSLAGRMRRQRWDEKHFFVKQ